VNLRYAFQDDENCFFVLDLMLGGDLRCESFRSTSLAASLKCPEEVGGGREGGRNESESESEAASDVAKVDFYPRGWVWWF